MRVNAGRGIALVVAASLVSLVAPTGMKTARSDDTATPAGGGGGAADASAHPTERAPEIAAAVRVLANDRALKDALVGVVVLNADTGAVLAETGPHVVVN